VHSIVNRPPAKRTPASIILAHAGGFVPYASHRFAELARVFRPAAAKPTDILASFQHFYLHTALSSSPAALPSLKAFAGSGRILFGTDFPFAPSDVVASFTAKLDAYEGLTADEQRAIMAMRGCCFHGSLHGGPRAPQRPIGAIAQSHEDYQPRRAALLPTALGEGRPGH
jgi:hypothetical protein